MTRALLIGSVVCLSWATFSGVSEAIIISALVLVIVATLAFRDLFIIRRRFEGLLLAGRRPRDDARELHTQIGRELADKLLVIRQRLGSLDHLVESADLGAVSVPKGEILEEVERGHASGDIVYFARILEFALRKFTATSAAIVLSRGDGCRGTVMRGIGDELLERHLDNTYDAWFTSGFRGNFGLLDWSKGGEAPTLERFGIGSAISFPFSLEGGGKGVMWLGYSRSSPPLEREVIWARDLARQMEGELIALQKLIELSGKVRHVERGSDEKSAFIAHVSHDIRSPLNNIRSVLQLLQLETCPSDKELVEVALSNCESLSEIVETILDYSSHQAGRLHVAPEVVEMNHLLSGIVASFAVSARLKGLDVRIGSLHEELFVEGDRRHLRRIFANLVSNAVKYTRRGYVEISAEVVGGSMCRVTVEDTGIGMTDEQRALLFEPFMRFHRGESEGAGLGLSLSKALIEMNRGEIRISSTKGRGTKVIVELPLKVATPHTIRFPESKKAAVSVDGIRVLVIDDDPDCAQSLARHLERRGCEVAQAYSVHDAMGLINFAPPQVIITDGAMPEGGGRRVLRFLKESHHEIPVLVLSGRVDEGEKAAYHALGAVAVMLKPAMIDDVVEWLSTLPQDSDTALVA